MALNVAKMPARTQGATFRLRNCPIFLDGFALTAMDLNSELGFDPLAAEVELCCVALARRRLKYQVTYALYEIAKFW